MDMNSPEVKELHKFMMEHMERERREKVKNYKLLNALAQKGQVLFTGSSLMEQFPVCELAASDGNKQLIYNRGVGGFTTDDFLAEIDTLLFDLEPSKLFINIGTNDMNEREGILDWKEHLLANYEEILRQIKERLPKTEVYMMAYYPVNASLANNEVIAHMLKIRTNENIHLVNEKVQALAGQYGFHYIDVNAGLTDENGNLKTELTKEGIHMFANAYEIVYSNLKQYL